MAGMSFGVFILVNRQMGNAIRTARNRNRHTILLIGSVRCYHPFSFLEPGGRSLFAFHNHLKTEKAAPQDCFLYGNINFFKGLFPISPHQFCGYKPQNYLKLSLVADYYGSNPLSLCRRYHSFRAAFDRSVLMAFCRSSYSMSKLIAVCSSAIKISQIICSVK